ncbi:MAG: hypothetical protein M3R54_10060 [Chloroflexota bacterium]|nr:hypothetical protein [Chloroflexota bacterium]
MGRRLGLIGVLTLLVTCGPTVLPRQETETPSASAPSTSDLITLREGGAQSYLAVRSVATSELVRQMPDGLLLPDGRTIAVVEPAVSTTTFRTVDRATGRTVKSRVVPGTWSLPQGGFGSPLMSPNGLFVVMTGSSYNFTDESGKWTARTSFAIVDTEFRFAEPNVVQLDGRQSYVGISNDGRSLYLSESIPPQLPTSSRLRVFDLRSHMFADVSGDQLPDPNAYFRTAPVSIGPYTFEIYAGKSPQLVRRDLDARTMQVIALPGDQVTSGADGMSGESVLMWSLIATRDGGTLYAVNAALGVVDEIDPGSLRLRRTARLTLSSDERGTLSALLGALHPVAYAKRGFTGAGAVLSPDEATLYAIGETGIWAIDTRSLTGRALTKSGAYSSIALGPGAQRVYVLGFEDGIVRVISAQGGSMLGAMKRVAFPTGIVSVEARG